MKAPVSVALTYGLLGGVLGFVLHAQLVAKLEAPVAREQARGDACEFDWLRMRGELHSVVRDTLLTTLHAEEQRRGAALPGAAAARPASLPPATLTTPAAAPDEQAWKDHVALLAAARQRGTWSEDDVARARQLVVAMTPEQRTRALAAVAAAINESHLKLTAPRPF